MSDWAVSLTEIETSLKHIEIISRSRQGGFLAVPAGSSSCAESLNLSAGLTP
jgi:hypothetical protein